MLASLYLRKCYLWITMFLIILKQYFIIKALSRGRNKKKVQVSIPRYGLLPKNTSPRPSGFLCRSRACISPLLPLGPQNKGGAGSPAFLRPSQPSDTEATWALAQAACLLLDGQTRQASEGPNLKRHSYGSSSVIAKINPDLARIPEYS